MLNEQFGEYLKFEKPATYRIRVVGHIDDSRSGQLREMIITRAYTLDQQPMTIIVGQLRDQASLAGILNELYELHLPLLTVESLSSPDNLV